MYSNLFATLVFRPRDQYASLQKISIVPKKLELFVPRCSVATAFEEVLLYGAVP